MIDDLPSLLELMKVAIASRSMGKGFAWFVIESSKSD